MMKCKRLTTKREKGVFSSFDSSYKLLCKDCRSGSKLRCSLGNCQEILAERLGELEDKIESGELREVPCGAVILMPEERDEEMKAGREERAVKEFAEKLKERVLKFVWKHNIPECMFNDIMTDLLKEYEKQLDEFADCKTCSAWSGSDCTRNPYTEGCLKEKTK